jgi:hypothetical protein
MLGGEIKKFILLSNYNVNKTLDENIVINEQYSSFFKKMAGQGSKQAAKTITRDIIAKLTDQVIKHLYENIPTELKATMNVDEFVNIMKNESKLAASGTLQGKVIAAFYKTPGVPADVLQHFASDMVASPKFISKYGPQKNTLKETLTQNGYTNEAADALVNETTKIKDWGKIERKITDFPINTQQAKEVGLNNLKEFLDHPDSQNYRYLINSSRQFIISLTPEKYHRFLTNAVRATKAWKFILGTITVTGLGSGAYLFLKSTFGDPREYGPGISIFLPCLQKAFNEYGENSDSLEDAKTGEILLYIKNLAKSDGTNLGDIYFYKHEFKKSYGRCYRMVNNQVEWFWYSCDKNNSLNITKVAPT